MRIEDYFPDPNETLDPIVVAAIFSSRSSLLKKGWLPIAEKNQEEFEKLRDQAKRLMLLLVEDLGGKIHSVQSIYQIENLREQDVDYLLDNITFGLRERYGEQFREHLELYDAAVDAQHRDTLTQNQYGMGDGNDTDLTTLFARQYVPTGLGVRLKTTLDSEHAILALEA